MKIPELPQVEFDEFPSDEVSFNQNPLYQKQLTLFIILDHEIVHLH